METSIANTILGALSEGDRNALVANASSRSYAAGERILSEEDPPAYFYILTKGVARVFFSGPKESQLTAKVFSAPAVFGEIELLCDLPMRESVEALRPCECFIVERDRFQALVDKNPTFAAALLKDIAARFCITIDMLRTSAFDPLRARLARMLLALADAHGYNTDTGTRLKLHRTQRQLATDLGVTERAIAKEFKRWQEAGVLERSKGHYIIADQAALRADLKSSALGMTYSIDQPVKVY